MNTTQTGILMLCLNCTILPLIGGLVGWWLKGRTARLGWPWGVLPEFIHRAYERITND